MYIFKQSEVVNTRTTIAQKNVVAFVTKAKLSWNFATIRFTVVGVGYTYFLKLSNLPPLSYLVRQNKHVLNINLTLVIVFRQFTKICAGFVSSLTQHICCYILQYLFIFLKYKLSKKT